MGLCPFHSEKSASFSVSPAKQFYHCFGCGAHGTAIGFLIEYSGLGFVDAVKDLAQGVGLVVPQDDDKIPPAQRAEYQAKSLALSDAMSHACDYYRAQLRGANRAINYLKGRGLTGEIAARFGLGYAPDAWDGLRTVFPDYELPTLVESGLVIDKSDDDGANRKRYDRFRDRIMFPIRNTKGQVIAFGGRIIDNGEPKYLNSPETPLFQKGNELYGLFEARQAIRDHGYVLVTEGYMDVVALAQLGFPQTVATLGTACSATHVQKLLRQTDHVVFSFDGDGAGRRAARRALDASLPFVSDDKIIKFLFLPTEHDPDSYIREKGTEAFERQVHDAMPLSQFLLKEVIGENDLEMPEGRARTQAEAKPLLQMMSPSSLRLQIVRGLATITQSTPSEIEVLFELAKPAARANAAPARSKRQQPLGLARQLLRLLVAHPVLAAQADQAVLTAIAKVAPDEVDMFSQLVSVATEMGTQANFAALAEHLRATSADFDGLIAEIAAESESEFDTERLAFTGAIRKIKIQALKSELEQLSSVAKLSSEQIARYQEVSAQLKQLDLEAKEEIGRR